MFFANDHRPSNRECGSSKDDLRTLTSSRLNRPSNESVLHTSPRCDLQTYHEPSSCAVCFFFFHPDDHVPIRVAHVQGVCSSPYWTVRSRRWARASRTSSSSFTNFPAALANNLVDGAVGGWLYSGALAALRVFFSKDDDDDATDNFRSLLGSQPKSAPNPTYHRSPDAGTQYAIKLPPRVSVERTRALSKGRGVCIYCINSGGCIDDNSCRQSNYSESRLNNPSSTHNEY